MMTRRLVMMAALLVGAFSVAFGFLMWGGPGSAVPTPAEIVASASEADGFDAFGEDEFGEAGLDAAGAAFDEFSEAEERQAELDAREDELARAEAEMQGRVRALEERVAAAERRARQAETRERTTVRRSDAPASGPGTDDGFIEESAYGEMLSRGNGPTAGTGEPVFVDEVAEPRVVNVTLDRGTVMKIEFLEDVSSETHRPGDPVHARLVSNVVKDDLVVLPAGAEVAGMVSHADRAKKIGGQSQLLVEFDRVRMPGGATVWIQASIDAAGKKQKGKDAATIGGATAGGAILGRALSKSDKPEGTLVGAILGGAIGTAIAANNKSDPVIFEEGQRTKLRLDAPVRIAVANTPAARDPDSLARR